MFVKIGAKRARNHLTLGSRKELELSLSVCLSACLSHTPYRSTGQWRGAYEGSSFGSFRGAFPLRTDGIVGWTG